MPGVMRYVRVVMPKRKQVPLPIARTPSTSETRAVIRRVATRIAASTEDTGDTQRDIADRCDVAYNYLWRARHGKVQPSLGLAIRLAAASGQRLSELLAAEGF